MKVRKVRAFVAYGALPGAVSVAELFLPTVLWFAWFVDLCLTDFSDTYASRVPNVAHGALQGALSVPTRFLLTVIVGIAG